MSSMTQQGYQQFSSPQTQQKVEENRAQISGLPYTAIQEAHKALQQLPELLQNASQSETLKVIVPIARSVGWTEALVFSLQQPNTFSPQSLGQIPFRLQNGG